MHEQRIETQKLQYWLFETYERLEVHMYLQFNLFVFKIPCMLCCQSSSSLIDETKSHCVLKMGVFDVLEGVTLKNFSGTSIYILLFLSTTFPYIVHYENCVRLCKLILVLCNSLCKHCRQVL